jgi:tetratricopeptide (TPR) repeat protein
MSTAVWTNRLELNSVADTALRVAVRFWFGVTLLGQLVFAFAVASFYGLTAARGDWQGWTKFMPHGYMPGHAMGNGVAAIHVFSAAFIILAGTLQLIPQIRNRFPVFHRWLGRIYVVTAFTLSGAGLYLLWFRGTVGDIWQHLGSTLNAVLIMVCAAMALRYAMARDFRTHRRWALRLYLVVSASLFIRAGIFLSGLLNHGPWGFNPITFTGPFLTFISFAQYLVPLGVLELYLRAQERPGAARRMGVAVLLFVLTIAMGAGIFGVAAAAWIPQVKAAYDSRKSVAQILSATVASGGIDEAIKQYHALKASPSGAYNFDEDELNTLGYQLIRDHRFKDAIRIFQLNVEAYPGSGNVYDSLAEGYMDDGDKALAIANYEKSLEVNPKNRNGVLMLEKLGVGEASRGQ